MDAFALGGVFGPDRNCRAFGEQRRKREFEGQIRRIDSGGGRKIWKSADGEVTVGSRGTAERCKSVMFSGRIRKDRDCKALARRGRRCEWHKLERPNSVERSFASGAY